MGNVWDSCLKDGVATINCVPLIFNNVANAFLTFSGVVAIFLIVWSGIRFITSGGDAKQVASARQTMTYAIVGLIVVLSAYALVFFIGYLTKTTNCITDINKINSGCQ
ncbi:MAG TPA: pilin [Patescibacteria group bacterium]